MLDRRAFVATGLGIMGSLALAGCGGGGGTSTGSSPSNDAKGKVYYLNFKPEQDAQWQELAEAYTEETGIPVTVKTAASGEYETTLKAEMAKSKAPTLFQVNGPVGLASWKDYCYDLDDADILKTLTSDSFALKGDDGKVKSVAYVIETYGLIYNKELLSKAGYEQKDITNFASLKAAVEDITSRKDELGFSAFTSCGMDSSSDWRFKTHLANLPIYIGAEGEDAQGLCTGSENYWCVNNKASEDDIKATLDFINWCVTSDAGTKAMCGAAGAMPSGADGMGFVIPFEGNLESENKLNQIADEYVADGKTPVDWCFSTMPSEEWKNGVGSALTTFASDQSDANWDAVKTAFVDGWATEAAATK